eukprot:2087722-Lingulodinium_polyedra.AAC.1
MLSVDIINDPKFGDLTDPRCATFWKDRVLSGQILGFVAGPPCATWSRARGHSDEARPVRAAITPWGL